MMTVLDLNDWMGDPVPGNPVSLCLGIGLFLGMIAVFIEVGRLREEEDNWIIVHWTRALLSVLYVPLLLFGVLPLVGDGLGHDPSLLEPFDVVVEQAYGLDSSDLPGGEPDDGSLSVVWEKDGRVGSGTLNLLDDKVSIQQHDGGYLEVLHARPTTSQEES